LTPFSRAIALFAWLTGFQCAGAAGGLHCGIDFVQTALQPSYFFQEAHQIRCLRYSDPTEPFPRFLDGSFPPFFVYWPDVLPMPFASPSGRCDA
jgi:hypothetical protein